MSRSYNLAEGNIKSAVKHGDVPGPILGMFPILDIINHYPIPSHQKPTQPTIFAIEHGLISTLCSLVQFDQSKNHHYFGTYGDKTNYELVSMYGFALEKNPDNDVQIAIRMSEHCTGSREIPGRCYYVTNVRQVSAAALINVISLIVKVNLPKNSSFEEIIQNIRRMPVRETGKKWYIFALLGYRNEVMRGITQGSVRELRRLKRKCGSYRCELIYTLLISQRVDRYLHTERIDRKTLELLLLDLNLH